MREVYRAHDRELERDVRVKVLPLDLAFDEDRVARLEREAKALVAINHPNIATIYGPGSSPSIRATRGIPTGPDPLG